MDDERQRKKNPIIYFNRSQKLNAGSGLIFQDTNIYNKNTNNQ